MNTDRVYYSRDAEAQAKRQTAALTMFALTLGLGIGALVGMLFSPSSGDKIRHQIGKRMGKTMDMDHDGVDSLVKRVEERLSDALKKIEDRLPLS